MKGGVQRTTRAHSQGNFLEEVMSTLRPGRVGVGHAGKEGSGVFGRVSSMCQDPEVREGMAREN